MGRNLLGSTWLATLPPIYPSAFFFSFLRILSIWKAERMRETERDNAWVQNREKAVSYQQVHRPDSCNNQGWARSKLGSRSQKVRLDFPSTWVITYYVLGSKLELIVWLEFKPRDSEVECLHLQAACNSCTKCSPHLLPSRWPAVYQRKTPLSFIRNV